MSTKQEVFDRIVSKLIEQGEPSIGKNPDVLCEEAEMICLYRSENFKGEVLKCAAGHEIPDELYDPKMENRNVLALPDIYPDLPEVFVKYNELLIDLQSAHDEDAHHHVDQWMQTFKYLARDVASKHSLEWKFGTV